jgi:IS5 family transposase
MCYLKRGMTLGAGTIVNAMTVAAPSMTKISQRNRVPGMRQRKNEQWILRNEWQIRVSSKTHLAHIAGVAAANLHDRHLSRKFPHSQ